VVTTPLILVILDAGEQQGYGVLGERIVATVIGAGLVIAANAVMRRLIRAAPQ